MNRQRVASYNQGDTPPCPVSCLTSIHHHTANRCVQTSNVSINVNNVLWEYITDVQSELNCLWNALDTSTHSLVAIFIRAMKLACLRDGSVNWKETQLESLVWQIAVRGQIPCLISCWLWNIGTTGSGLRQSTFECISLCEGVQYCLEGPVCCFLHQHPRVQHNLVQNEHGRALETIQWWPSQRSVPKTSSTYDNATMWHLCSCYHGCIVLAWGEETNHCMELQLMFKLQLQYYVSWHELIKQLVAGAHEDEELNDVDAWDGYVNPLSWNTSFFNRITFSLTSSSSSAKPFTRSISVPWIQCNQAWMFKQPSASYLWPRVAAYTDLGSHLGYIRGD